MWLPPRQGLVFRFQISSQKLSQGVTRALSLEENGADLLRDREFDMVQLRQGNGGPGRVDALGHHRRGGDGLRERRAASDRFPQTTISAVAAGRRGDEIAQAGQAPERFGL